METIYYFARADRRRVKSYRPGGNATAGRFFPVYGGTVVASTTVRGGHNEFNERLLSSDTVTPIPEGWEEVPNEERTFYVTDQFGAPIGAEKSGEEALRARFGTSWKPQHQELLVPVRPAAGYTIDENLVPVKKTQRQEAKKQ